MMSLGTWAQAIGCKGFRGSDFCANGGSIFGANQHRLTNSQRDMSLLISKAIGWIKRAVSWICTPDLAWFVLTVVVVSIFFAFFAVGTEPAVRATGQSWPQSFEQLYPVG
jgi:hypothetical protein